MDNLQDRDFKWFVDNYDKLFKQYGVGYLAIKNQKVLGKYNTVGDALRTTRKTEEVGTFIIQYCDGTETAYTNYIYTIGAVAV